MIKVGILLKSTKCDRYLTQMIQELEDNNKIKLIFLLNKNSTLPKENFLKNIFLLIKKRGFLNFFSLLLFKIISTIESKILSMLFKDIKEHSKRLSIEHLIHKNILYLTPNFSKSGIVVTYETKDIEKIKSLELDLIIRGNAEGIFKGDILKSSKEGIISFHHGDNRWNRGGPAGFWEVYLKKDTTGFIIQILSEELDGGEVIFRSDIATRRSYIENLTYLYRESYPFMSKVIIEYAQKGHLPIAEEPLPYGGTLLKVPRPLETILYAFKTFYLFLSYGIKRIFLQKHDRWSVAFTRTNWNKTILRKGVEIKNCKNRFFADPFIVTEKGKTVCFVEDYSYVTKLGSISAIEIFDDNSYKIEEYVIKELFHMSFPYLFRYKDELYMVPETSQAKSIRLYKCIEFPTKWEYQKDLFSDIYATDTMIFFHNNLWWMMFSLSNTGKNYNSQLVAYYTKSDPIHGEWIAHAQNPIVKSCSIARNAGVLGLNEGVVIRNRQKQGFNLYGGAFSLAKIVNLTPTEFKEEEISKILPNFLPNLKGTHHMHSNGEYTVFDYFRNGNLN